jgi:hypothetical protein
MNFPLSGILPVPLYRTQKKALARGVRNRIQKK